MADNSAWSSAFSFASSANWCLFCLLSLNASISTQAASKDVLKSSVALFKIERRAFTSAHKLLISFLASAKFKSSDSWMHSNFSIIDVMLECVSSGVLEPELPELPSFARLLALLGIFDGKSQNLTRADSYVSVTIAWSHALFKTFANSATVVTVTIHQSHYGFKGF